MEMDANKKISKSYCGEVNGILKTSGRVSITDLTGAD